MLNKKTKENFAISKISLIFPAILAFMLCFNVKSEAQSITSPLEESKETDVFEIMIYNTASEEDLREFKKLAKNKNILLQFEDVKRNKEGKISTIQTTFQDLKSDKTGSLNQSNSEGVAVLVFSRNSDGSISMFSLTKKKNTKLVSKNSQENKEIPRNPLYILNGKKSQKEIIDLIDTDLIERINVLKGKNAVSLYGEEAKDGAVVITTKILDSKKQSSETMKEIIIYPNARKKYNSDNPYSYKATKEDGPIMVVDGEKTEPMVIIDGEKSNRSAFKEINPENIEKITVLKGQKAMQKYGKEAYQGAIEITSKNDKK